ncbi:MAG: N-acetyltransferase family protein [Pseudomonadota bacterium]
MEIRHLKSTDWGSLVDLYNHYIKTSPCTFDIAATTALDRQPWFDQFADSTPHQCLVAIADERVLGYACSTKFKERPAYSTSVEVSVYVAHNNHHQGLGSDLYAALFENLSSFNLHRAYAGIVLPNDPSVRLHTKFGFKQVGLYNEVGYKFDRYWDVGWFEKVL